MKIYIKNSYLVFANELLILMDVVSVGAVDFALSLSHSAKVFQLWTFGSRQSLIFLFSLLLFRPIKSEEVKVLTTLQSHVTAVWMEFSSHVSSRHLCDTLMWSAASFCSTPLQVQQTVCRTLMCLCVWLSGCSVEGWALIQLFQLWSEVKWSEWLQSDKRRNKVTSDTRRVS